MASITNGEERRLLDLSLDGTYLCLFTAAPTEGGLFTDEIAAASYERVLATWNAASTDGSGDTTKVPSGDLILPTATEDWGIITHFGYASVSSAGLLRWWAPMSEPKEVLAGDTYKHLAAITVASFD